MPNFAAIQGSGLTKTLAASIADADAIKTSIATSTSAVTYSGAALNGAATTGNIRGTAAFGVGATVSVTTAASASTYNTTDPIVFVGTYKGTEQREELYLTAAGGNQKVEGKKPFDSVTSIQVPAQLTTSGSFQFGVEDAACDGERETIRGILVGANPGTLTLLYQAIPLVANPSDAPVVIANQELPISPRAVDGSATTCWPITLLF